MIHFLDRKATDSEVAEMLEALESYIKLAVDIEKEVIAGGGELHADCEAVLLEHGSLQENVWGADWLPYSKQVTFESLINLRPRQNNFSMDIQDEALRKRVSEIVEKIFLDN